MPRYSQEESIPSLAATISLEYLRTGVSCDEPGRSRPRAGLHASNKLIGRPRGSRAASQLSDTQSHAKMRGVTSSRRLLLAALIVLALGVQLLEASGHWDRTFEDANDEIGVVAVVLCIGIAISVIAAIVKRIQPSHMPGIGITVAAPLTLVAVRRLAVSSTSPPSSLRI
jgi:hypothetical protein